MVGTQYPEFRVDPMGSGASIWFRQNVPNYPASDENNIVFKGNWLSWLSSRPILQLLGGYVPVSIDRGLVVG